MKYRLLIVDDEREVREVLSEIVDWSGLGFEVVQTLKDGRDTIAYLEQHRVDVVLSDIKMTFESGIDVARFIKERQLPVKVVLLSGYQEFQLAQEAIRYDVSDYLLKPTDLEELYRVFRNLKQELDSGAAAKQAERQDRERFASYLLFQSDSAAEEIARHLEQLNTAVNPMREPCALLEVTVAKDNGELSKADVASSKKLLANTVAGQFPSWLMLLDNREMPPYYAVICMASEHQQLHGQIQQSLQRLNAITALKAQLVDFRRFDNLAPLLAEYRIRNLLGAPPAVKSEAEAGPQRRDGNAFPGSGSQPSGGKWAIRQAVAYIEEHYSQNLSLELVAGQVHLNPVYFGQLFKQETKKNFLDYLVEIRMEHAKQLLKTSSLKIYEICERVGYKDIKYFYKLFKREVGITPTEYRDRC
ncbi:response regulator [Paenibacillus sp. PAMC21692]|uniref:response regulator transcription factor n=1 Tax=Paenibacillus sp. PAMC21692 TaxID=2762320 RepID=UPI00164E06A7|nr:response regulator [Paenibacillus sp. PAMC21692]QNK58433.1 response regulator [Paenibacillus sp. PAMC21692]